MPVPGSEFEIEADSVIMALGTSPNPLIARTTAGLDTTRRGCLVADEDGVTTRPGVFAGGDAVTGAATVILAMGARHRHLDVPGEEEYSGRGVSYCATCDGPFFKGRKVVVVGGGDTALTDAVYLSRLCSSVKVVHRRNEFRAQKAIQDKMRACSNIQTVTPHTVKEILGDGEKVTGVVLDDGSLIETDGIFIFTGILPNSQIVKDLVELDEAGFVRTDSMMRTSLEGVYAVGDLRTTPFRQVVTAAGDGAVAAHMADEYLNR